MTRKGGLKEVMRGINGGIKRLIKLLTMKYYYHCFINSPKVHIPHLKNHSTLQLFQMTSFGCNCKEVQTHGLNPDFKLEGQVRHLIGSLLPNDSETAKFLQIYFLDDSVQVKSKMTISNNFELTPSLMHMLQETLHNYNKYIRELKSAYQYARQQNL